MRRYRLPNGRVFTLHDLPQRHAERLRRRLLDLGCSPAYADWIADQYRRAVLA